MAASMNRMMNIKAKVANSLLLIVSLLIGLALAEAGLHFFYPVDYKKPPPKPGWSAWRNLIHQRSDVPGLSYELVPHAKGHVVQTDVLINSHGMRDRERAIEKNRDTKRIAVLGDSFTFGFNVDSSDLFTCVLERMLNDSIDNQGQAFEVLNFGVGGYSARDEAVVLKHKVPQWKPDLIIINYILNDALMDPHQPLHAHFKKVYWWQYIHLGRLVAQNIDKYKKKEPWIADFFERIYHRESHNWQGVVQAFKDIKATAAVHNYEVVLMVFAEIPNGLDWNNYDHIRKYELQVIAEGKKNGFHVLDLFESFKDHIPDDLRTSEKDHHPNTRGHFLTARFLKEKLTGEYRHLFFSGKSPGRE